MTTPSVPTVDWGKKIFPELPGWQQSFGCMSLFVLLLLMVHPVAEMGMYDDWSYVHSAALLAQTGHIHYNGWAAPMLGWHLYPAALLFRMFGVSFTIARMTTMVEAAVVVLLIHRIAARCGLHRGNAFVLTMLLCSSPLFLPLATIYMSDMAGCLAILVCLYSCLRGLQARTSRAAAGWLAAAALLNAVGGTARQIAWLGVLVMVPCAVWILRRDRHVVLYGLLATAIGDGFVAYCLHWFKQQPYAKPESIFGHRSASEALPSLSVNALEIALLMGLLLLPLLIAFLAPAWRSKVGKVAMSGSLGGAVLLLLYLHHGHSLRYWLLPNMREYGNFLAPEGLFTQWPVFGARPALLGYGVRLGLTLLVVAALSAAVVVSRRGATEEVSEAGLAERRIRGLIVCFLVAYFALLIPRASFQYLFDRYALPPMILIALLAALLYQRSIRAQLPPYATGLVVVFGLYGATVTHDLFAMYRGAHQAVLQAGAKGIPATAIDGGWEASALKQLQTDGFVRPVPVIPPGKEGLNLDPDPRPCEMYSWFLYPVMHIRYALAFEPSECGGDTGLAPTTFHTWLPNRDVKIFVVRN